MKIDILNIMPALIVFKKRSVSTTANYLIILENYPVAN